MFINNDLCIKSSEIFNLENEITNLISSQGLYWIVYFILDNYSVYNKKLCLSQPKLWTILGLYIFGTYPFYTGTYPKYLCL